MSEVVDALEIDPAVVKVATEVLSGKCFFFFFLPRFILECTPPKFNSKSSENPSQKEASLPTIHFSGANC